jgi:hypothetical protein
MPIKRRHNKRREDLPEEAEQWLHGESKGLGFFPYSLTDQEFADLWAEHADRIIDEHVAEFPGTRPYRWWQYDAPRIAVGASPDCFWDGKLPEPRIRIGGVGTPRHECLGYVPDFSYGLPTTWISQRDVEYYTGSARDVQGNLINPKPPGTFKGVAIDPDDPPTYESQAAYLERHGLYLPGERRRLTKRDFEPEAIGA